MSYAHRVRILPLGDSLTQGDGNPSAYRYDLYRLLDGADIPFRFVGGVCGGDWRLPPDCRYHSSRGGITTNGLIAYHTEGSEVFSPAWVEAIREAEVALVCIGANDIYRGLPVEEYTARLVTLLDMLYSYNPALSTVFIATMRTNWGANEKQIRMNAALLDPAFAAAEAAKGRDVRVLDFNGEGAPENLKSDYPPDDGHPNAVGNRKLAELWFAGIAERIAELASTLTPADARPLPPVSCETAVLSVPVGGGARIRLTPASGGEVSYLFESENAAVAEVDEDGTVYGCREGECTVRVMTARGCRPIGHVRVSVLGTLADVLDAYPVRKRPEISEAGYIAPEKALRPTAGGVCVRYPHWIEGEIVTREAYPQGEVCLAFDMTAVSAFPTESSGFLTLSLGDMSLTFRHFGTDMTLTVGEHSVTLTDPTPPYGRRPMRLVREGSRATLLRGGVVLLTLTGLSAPTGAPAPLSITWSEYHAMIHYFYDLTVATRA